MGVEPAPLDRRVLLRTAGIFLGASALNSRLSFRETSGSTNQSYLGALKKGFMRFMLAHEQFPVTKLVELGARPKLL